MTTMDSDPAPDKVPAFPEWRLKLRAAADTMGSHSQQAWRHASAALKSFTNDSLGKTLTLLTLIVLGAVITVVAALTLRFVSPESQITVSAIQILGSGQQDNGQSGKALADLVVDSIHQILENADTFSGNAYSSSQSFKPVPNMPQIPVDTSYGIEIKGISLDQLLATWSHLRCREFQISGDVMYSASGSQVMRLRYVTESHANAFEETLPQMDPAGIKQAITNLSLDIIKDINPEAAARYLMATAYACTRNCADAWESPIQFCWSWTKREPNNALPFFYLGYALGKTDHSDDALIYLDRSLELNRHLDLALNMEGSVLMDEGRVTDAEQAFQKALKIRKTANPAMNLGVVALREGDFEKAQKYYQEALHLDPNDAGAYLNLGFTSLQLGRNADAIAAYQHVREIRPGDNNALQGLVFALSREDKLKEALRECDAAAFLDPNVGAPLAFKGLAYLMTNQPELAIQQIQAAIQKDNPYRAHVLLGIAFIEKGDIDSALKKFEQLASVSPNDAESHFFLSKIFEAEGDMQDSKLELDKTNTLGPWLKYTSLDVTAFGNTCCARVASVNK